MVHKVKSETDEMDEYIADMDRQQDEYVKSLEADMKRQEEDFKRQMKEAEAMAVGTYETVKGLGESAKKGVESVKKGVAVAKVRAGELERGAKEVWQKFKGAPKRPQWFQREPVRVSISPEIQKKREKDEKEYAIYGS